jgi:hypothetical protein
MRPVASGKADAASTYERKHRERAADLARRLIKKAGDDRDLLRIYALPSARLERDNAARAIYRDRLGGLGREAEVSIATRPRSRSQLFTHPLPTMTPGCGKKNKAH